MWLLKLYIFFVNQQNVLSTLKVLVWMLCFYMIWIAIIMLKSVLLLSLLLHMYFFYTSFFSNGSLSNMTEDNETILDCLKMHESHLQLYNNHCK